MDFILHLCKCSHRQILGSGPSGSVAVCTGFWHIAMLPSVGITLNCHQWALKVPAPPSPSAQCVVKNFWLQDTMSEKHYFGMVLICICLLIDHVVSDHFWEVRLTEKVILFVLSLFLHFSPPHLCKQLLFCQLYEIPSRQKGPRVAKFQLDFILVLSPGIFFFFLVLTR